MSVIDDLRARANLIKYETEEGANTHDRVGGLFYDLIDYTGSIGGGSSEKTEVIVTPLLSTGVGVANISVDGRSVRLWAPRTYDDTNIQNSITDINRGIRRIDAVLAQSNILLNQVREKVADEQERLENVIAEIDTSIKKDIQDLEETADWINHTFPQGQVLWQSGWDNNIEAYLSRVGVWARNGGITTTQWSELTQKVDGMQSTVNQIQSTEEYVEALQSSISQSVSNNIASLKLENTYAKKDEAEKVLQWMYSAFSSGVSDAKSYAEIVASGNISDVEYAISDITLSVEKVDEYLKSKNTFSNKVEDAVNTIIQEASPDNSITTIASSVGGWSEAGVVLETTLDSSLSSISSQSGTFAAGLVTEAKLDRYAETSLVAKNDYNAAVITAMINDSGSGVIIDADKIDLNGVSEILGEIRLDSEGLLIGNLAAIDSGANVPYLRIDNGDITYSGGTVKARKGYSLQENEIELWDSRLYGYGISNTVKLNPVKLEFASPLQGYSSHESLVLNVLEADNKAQIIVGNGMEIIGNVSQIGNLSTYSLSATNAKVSQGLKLWNENFTINKSGSEIGMSATNDILLTTENGKISIEPTSNLNLKTTDGGIYIQSTGNDDIIAVEARGDISIEAKDKIFAFGGDEVYVYANSFTGNVPYTGGSDERMKNIHSLVTPDINSIAGVRIVDYSMKKDSKGIHRLGSIAQDWQDIFPNAIGKDKEGYLNMDYAGIALASAVTAAREIVELKKRIEKLEKAN